MSSFKLKIMSPDGIFYDGDAYQLSLRSVDGEVSILAGHIPYLTAVGIGECRLYEQSGEKPRRAACCGGMLSVDDEGVLLSPTTFEWAKDIDIERAKAAKTKAEQRLAEPTSSAKKSMAKLKLQRANLRISIAEKERS